MDYKTMLTCYGIVLGACLLAHIALNAKATFVCVFFIALCGIIGISISLLISLSSLIFKQVKRLFA